MHADINTLHGIKTAICTSLQKNRQRERLAGYAKRELEGASFFYDESFEDVTFNDAEPLYIAHELGAGDGNDA
ncbi:hypothetical protein [Veillonella montpellierensis]|uniref:hypothetical protein n=1 Tax=Veillonella montpellierensis TaxID=187328 RepID=UPI0023F7EFF1|nr:hypothetical protein [Veillonella montpellierensis]